MYISNNISYLYLENILWHEIASFVFNERLTNTNSVTIVPLISFSHDNNNDNNKSRRRWGIGHRSSSSSSSFYNAQSEEKKNDFLFVFFFFLFLLFFSIFFQHASHACIHRKTLTSYHIHACTPKSPESKESKRTNWLLLCFFPKLRRCTFINNTVHIHIVTFFFFKWERK
jgi:hypothetical protein